MSPAQRVAPLGLVALPLLLVGGVTRATVTLERDAANRIRRMEYVTPLDGKGPYTYIV